MTLNGRNALLQKSFYATHQNNLNKDRPILSAAKCRTMILVSGNIRYMRIFAGVPRKGGVNDSGFVKFSSFSVAICSKALDRISRIYIHGVWEKCPSVLGITLTNLDTVNHAVIVQ